MRTWSVSAAMAVCLGALVAGVCRGGGSDLVLGPPDEIAARWVAPGVSEELRRAMAGVYSTNAAIRGVSLERLGALHEKAALATPWLVGLLADDAPADEEGTSRGTTVGKRAAETIVAIGSSSVPSLIDSLVDSCEAVRIAVVHAMGEIRAREAVKPLVGRIGEASDTEAQAIAEALGKMQPDGMDAISAILTNESARARMNAVRVLAHLNDRGAVPLLARRLREDGDSGVRAHAAEALGRLGDPSALAAVTNALWTDGDVNVRKASVNALAAFGPAGIKALGHAIRDQDESTALAAVEAATGMRDPGIAAALTDVVKARVSPDILREAVPALASHAGLDSIAALLSALSVDDEHVRRAVAEALPRLGTNAVAPMLAYIRDPTNSCREWLLCPLAKAGGVEAIAPLDELLADPQLGWEAARALCEVRASQAVGPLSRYLLDHRGESVAKDIIIALGEIGDTNAVLPLANLLNDSQIEKPTREEAARALGAIGGVVGGQSLVFSLWEEDQEIRDKISAQLDRLDIPFTIYERALADERPLIRRASANRIRSGSDARAADALVRALEDVPMVRLRAACSLAVGGDERGIAVCKEFVCSSNETDVALAVRALAATNAPGTVAPLLQILTNETVRASTRETAAVGLGRHKAAGVVEHLVASLRDSEWEVRRGAANALGSLSESSTVRALAEMATAEREPSGASAAATNAIVSMSIKAVSTLVSALEDEDTALRATARTCLREIGAAAVPALIRELSGTNGDVRATSTEVLGEIGDPRALTALLQTVRDCPDDAVAGAAVAAVARFGAMAAPGLLELAAKGDERACSRVLPSLAQTTTLRSAVAGPLMSGLLCPDASMRVFAARTLARIGERRAVRQIAFLLADREPAVRKEALEAFGTLGAGPATAVSERLNDSEPEVRWAAADTALRIGDSVVQPLSVLLSDKTRRVRWMAAELLARLGTAATAPLVSQTASPDPDVCTLALWALCENTLRRRDAAQASYQARCEQAFGKLEMVRWIVLVADDASTAWNKVKRRAFVAPVLRPPIPGSLEDMLQKLGVGQSLPFGSKTSGQSILDIMMGRRTKSDGTYERLSLPEMDELDKTLAAAVNPFASISLNWLAKTQPGLPGMDWDGGLGSLLIEAMEKMPRDIRRRAVAGAVPKRIALPVADAPCAPLLEALSTTNSEVRILVLRALADVQPPAAQALPVLMKVLDDPNDTVRQATLDALWRITGNVLGHDAEEWRLWWSRPENSARLPASLD